MGRPEVGESSADRDGGIAGEARRLRRHLLELATAGKPRYQFLKEVCAGIDAFSGCRSVGLVLGGERRCTAARRDGPDGIWTVRTRPPDPAPWSGSALAGLAEGAFSPPECAAMARLELGEASRFWHGGEPAVQGLGDGGWMEVAAVVSGDEPLGVLIQVWQAGAAPPAQGLGLGVVASRHLAGALVYHRAQAALRERVKELTCLYNLNRLTGDTAVEPPVVLDRVAALLPPAWQYPEITAARITFDDARFPCGEMAPGLDVQAAPVVVRGENRGLVEVAYTEERPRLDEGPFLAEERSLIEAVARQVGLYLERRLAREESARLQEQLRHADRLATIGQLSAGVAHELNEPLAGILGFAQLALKDAQAPAGVLADLERIVNASLHAREIIKKLMLFSRQTPPRTEAVDLNQLVRDGLYFLESRCAKQGVRVRRELDQDLPAVMADPGQVQQVLVNLTVNAVQAMPEGGELTLRTRAVPPGVALVVQDTGVGMEKSLREKIFLPFFTTKEVDQGTGLGLAVVHGIITAHGGRIEVDSQPGEGSRFTVWLPVRGPGTEEDNGER